MQWKFLGRISVDFDAKVNYWSYIAHLQNNLEGKGIKWNIESDISRLQENLWFRRKILYNILNQFGIPILVRQIN